MGCDEHTLQQMLILPHSHLGGGTGIGLMQTLALIENGAKVFITSRNTEKLQDVAKKYGGDGQSKGEIIP